MHTAAAIAAQEVDHTDPVEKKVQDLIRRFNDPDGEHVLKGIFKDTDSLSEIVAKQLKASTMVSCALAELVALKTAAEFLQGQGRP
jgi:hypothetical protein